MADMVKMKAIAEGTIVGPRGILHTDPRPIAVQEAREPVVTEAEAVVLEKAKLAERVGEAEAPEDEGSSQAGEGGSTLGVAAAEKVQIFAEQDAETDTATGLDTRGTTHFPVDPAEYGASTDADAPPTKRRGRPPKAEPAPASPGT